MQYSLKNGFLWLSIYVLLALIPMIIAVAGDLPEFRTFWIEFGVALGFMGLSLFALQFIFSGRIRRIAPKFGTDNLINFHRQIGITAFFLILAHPVTLIIAEPSFIAYFDPRINFMRAIALSFVTIAIIFITVTSMWRMTFKLQYEYWRLLHGFLALAIVFIGVVHAMQVSHYMEPLWKKIGLGAVMSAAMYMVIHTRMVRPWMNKKKPYTITNIKEEIGDCFTISLKPDGHPKMDFIPGQFAWITIGSTPFSLQQNPFTFSSSARSDVLKFTAKTDGDFTSTWKNIPDGTKAWLEGPFGSFTPVKGRHLFFIMGGIGVTTAISMLRTMRDDKDPRKTILVYANTSVEEITFHDEIEKLSFEIDLKVVHVLNEPSEDWEGEEGYVTEELLERLLPDDHSNYLFYICGPAPMMDMAGIALHDLGIKWNHIYMERFQIV
ncbi:MAG: ferric reductase-like transmembrane domain-containing protein [Balneolaceae bacterium]|nr:ferric reductase-like transmembrane domain-containing protein [Balneolaceae bacterium]